MAEPALIDIGALKDVTVLSIIVPAYNEDAGIERAVSQLAAAFPEAEVIVVDDGSNDRTAEVLAGISGIKVLRHAFNRGYGASLKTGMSQAAGEVIAWFDADNEHRAEDLALMVEKIVAEPLAAVIGQRENPAPSVLRSTGKWAIRMLARNLGATRAKDFNCGLRVFRRDAILPYLSVLPDKYSASLTSTLVMMAREYPIQFQPIRLNERIGTSKVEIRDGFSALLTVFRITMLVAPMRIFFKVGAICAGLAGSYGVGKMLLMGGSFPISAFVLATFGMLLCMLGLIADQISQMRLQVLKSGIGDTPDDTESDSPVDRDID